MLPKLLPIPDKLLAMFIALEKEVGILLVTLLITPPIAPPIAPLLYL